MKGVYLLIIGIKNAVSLKVGALGQLTFQPGRYAYVGSAQTSIESRVARHLRRKKRLFWHIDYLLNNEEAKINGIYYMDGPKTQECQIANNILQNGGEPIQGFGSSDCSCTSHLFCVRNIQFLEKLMKPLLF